MLINLKSFYLILVLINIQYVYGIFEFRKVRYVNNYDVTITNDELLAAVEMGKSNFEMLKNLENSLVNSNVKLSYGSPSYGQYLESWPNEKAKEIDKIAQTILKASIQLLNMNCILNNPSKRENCAKIISSFHLPLNSGIKENCTAFKQQSNNHLHTYRRLLPPNYADGIYKMHTVNVQPKGISNRFYDSQMINETINAHHSSSEGILDAEKNIALVQWTQFIEHDLAKTVVQTMCNNEPIECCSNNLNHPRPRFLHPSCAALNIEGLNSIGRCLNYVRSALGIDYDCKFGSANQLNQASNQLDLSQLYGTTKEEKQNLRTFLNGELKSSDHPEYSYLPESNIADRLCMHHNIENNICYKSGDTRVNANPYTITLYTIFLRSHNMLAKKIRQQNPNVQHTDDDIYERAKKLNKYIYQKIIYEEWARIVLGDAVTEQLNNEPFRTVRSLSNSPQASDRSVSNEFATAAIRFYYSMIPGDLSVNDELSIAPSQFNVINSLRKKTMKLENEFYKPQDLSFESRMENFLEAILNQRAMAMDSGYVDDVIKKLFCYPNAFHQNQSIGTDVLALDIIRGRDHGLANYISYLTECTKDVIGNWEDLKKYINNRDISLLKEIYTTPDKIDLIVGAITEKPLHGSTVGPTLQCIIGEQLSNTRQTDEEFYGRPSERNFYNQISQYTGAKLLCETTKLTEVPRNIFKIPSASNPLVKCNSLI